MHINYLAFPYRNAYFKKKYGISVRDLQIIEVLKKRMDTGKILIADRPLTVYEALLGRTTENPDHLRHISLDLVGALKGRSWTANCYAELKPKLLNEIASWDNVVILDFTPIANIHTLGIPSQFYWYDLIDNFSIHNRFTAKEKELVRQKYESVSQRANIITGVSGRALARFPEEKRLTITNALYDPGRNSQESEPDFKYGFLGFLTNKFDVSFIEKLARADPHFSLVIYGDSYDKAIAKQLSRSSRITLKGKFKKDDTPNIMKTFQVGLIPYLESRSHDGSPLKLYEYLHYGKPVLTSIDYEITGSAIVNYNKRNLDETLLYLTSILKNPTSKQEIMSMLRREDYLEYKIEQVVSRIQSHLGLAST